MTQKRWRVAIPAPRSGETERMLTEAGCELILGKSVDEFPGWKYDERELIALCKDADAIVAATREHFTRAVLAGVSRLRVVSKIGIGVENIDVEAASEMGIVVAHTPIPEHYTSVAEGTMCLILMLVKGVKAKEAILRSGQWKRSGHIPGNLFWRKTVGIVGLGRIGSKVAEGMSPWAVNILAYDPYVTQERANSFGARLVSLEELLRESDVVTLHVVITPETRNMIGEKELRMMKPTAYIVNTSRGEAIDEMALAKALKERWIAGAALDVFEEEPLPQDHPLRAFNDNLILTPHLIGTSPETRLGIDRTAAENLLQALRGEFPTYPKNPEVRAMWEERMRRLS